MSKKGISPVIATMLLVGVVVALSTVVFIWARGFIGESITKNQKPVDQVCSELNLGAVYYSSEGKLQVSNTGSISVSQLTISVESGGEFSQSLMTTKVLAGDTSEVSVSTGATNVEVTPWILGETSSGQKDYAQCENVVVRAEII